SPPPPSLHLPLSPFRPRPPPRPTLFPYTTLFRSPAVWQVRPRPLPHDPARVHTPLRRAAPTLTDRKDNHGHHTAPVHPLGDPGTGPGGLHGPDRPRRPTRTHPGNTVHTPGGTPGRDPLRGPGLRPGPGRAHRPGVRAGHADPSSQRRVPPRTRHPVRHAPGPAGFSGDRTRGPHPHGRGRTPDRPGEPLHPVRGSGRCGPPRG